MTLPIALEAEMRLLGGSMKSSDWVNLTVTRTKASDYYDPRNRYIWSIIHDLYELDSEVTLTKIEARMDSKQCSIDYLVDLKVVGNIGLEIDQFLFEVKEASRKRQFVELSKDFATDSCRPDRESKDILSSMESKIFSFAEQEEKKVLVHIKEVMNDPESIMKSLQNRQELFMKGINAFKGVPTGYYDLDTSLKGLAPGHLMIVGARPGVGKTTFALNLMENLVTKFDCKALFFSLEMPSLELASKLVCQRANISMQKFSDGNITGVEYQKINESFKELESKTIIIDDQSSLSIDKLMTRAVRAKRVHGINVIFIDYVQLVTSNRKGTDIRHLEIADISRRLKEMAKELEVPVVALAQLNRDLEKRTDKKPFLSDLRESGSLEADADEILLLHRPEMYDPYDKPGLMEVFISKNRFGPTGKILLTYTKETGKINNYANPFDKNRNGTDGLSEAGDFFSGIPES